MAIISAGLAIVILGFLYWRMIKRETPKQIGALQALVPIALGVVSMFIGALATILLAKSLGGMANMLAGNKGFGGSLLRAFLMAGGTEEAAKLLMILLALVILKSRVKNVYEYVLIGAAVGLGFAVAEEFYYGDFSAGSSAADSIMLVERTISVPAHMTFSMVMAEFLGRARFNKLTGKGSPALDCILAALIPMGVHSLYDSCTAFNSKLINGEMSGIVMALAGYVGLLVYELVVLIRFRKSTEKICDMRISAAEARGMGISATEARGVNPPRVEPKKDGSVTRRNHTLSEKLPLLSMLLSIAAATLVCGLAATLSSSEVIQYLLSCAAGILCLLAQKWWFAPEFKGVFRIEVPFREIGLLCVPFMVQLLLSWLLNVLDHGLFFHATALSVAMALSAGFAEEVMFRGLAVPIGMRYLKGENRILITALVTSVVFGLTHLGNAMGGNAIGIVQAIASIGTALLYAAVFLRTGSIMVTIVMHCLFDWLYFLTNPALQSGDMASMGVTIAVIISCIVDLSMSAVGLWLIRPAAREQIEAVWQKKWGFADSDDGTENGVRQYQPKHRRPAS